MREHFALPGGKGLLRQRNLLPATSLLSINLLSGRLTHTMGGMACLHAWHASQASLETSLSLWKTSQAEATCREDCLALPPALALVPWEGTGSSEVKEASDMPLKVGHYLLRTGFAASPPLTHS